MSKTCDCPLAGNQEVRFSGNLEADIIFAFESPGYTELQVGEAMRGKAGKRWETELNKIGLKREEVFVLNASRCMLNKKTLSDSQIKQILKSCRFALKAAIEHIKPKVIVACGGIASHSVMGVPITGIKKRWGTWAFSEEFNCQVLYTIHPSATLRNEGDLPKFQQDLRSLRSFVDNNFTVPSEETNYKEVQSIQFILDKKDITVGIDTETQGLKWFDDNFVLISYSISDEERTGYNIVLWEEVLPQDDEIPEHDKCITWHRDKENDVPVFLKKSDNYDTKVKELHELLNRKDIKKYTKNGIGYDCHVFESAGLPPMINHAMDTQIASHTLDSELHLNNSLGSLVQSYTTMPAWKEEFSSTYKKEDMLFSLRENRKAFTEYAVKDADGTRRVGLAIREEMMKDSRTANYYIKLVHPVSETVLYNISKNGILIDKKGIRKAELEVLEELDICEKECIKRIPQAVQDKHAKFINEKGILNLNRSRLIIDTLFSEEGFGLTPKAFTAKSTPEKQVPQVSKDVLKQIKNNSKKAIREFIEWRENREELHTILKNYLKNYQKYVTSKNRLHTSMSTSFTVTGRCGSRQPNTMVFPSRNKKQKKIVKSLFVAPEGYKLLNLDLSQAELRFIAHESQDERMMDAYKNDEDIHIITAKTFVARSGKKWEDLTKAEQKTARQKAKPANFGLSYLLSVPGLKDYALNDYGIRLSLQEAKEMWGAWHNLYPKVKEWQDKCIQEMYREGKVRTIFGRNRYLRILHSKDEQLVKRAEREGVNVKIQGPSSDYTLLGGYQMYKSGLIDEINIKEVNFVHDSLAYEIIEDKIEYYAKELKYRMEHVDTLTDFGFELSVPMKVDIQIGDDLYSMEEMKL